jgi:hypothetical protein
MKTMTDEERHWTKLMKDYEISLRYDYPRETLSDFIRETIGPWLSVVTVIKNDSVAQEFTDVLIVLLTTALLAEKYRSLKDRYAVFWNHEAKMWGVTDQQAQCDYNYTSSSREGALEFIKYRLIGTT